MKSKMKRVLGMGLTFVLLVSLFGFALPVSASPGENEWSQFKYPAEGADDGWFRHADIGYVGPMAEAINGDLYAAVGIGSAATLDSGAAWSDTQVHSGISSAKLTDGDYVEFVPAAGITMADLASGAWNYWYWYDYTVLSGGPNIELRFTMPVGYDPDSTTGHVDVNVQAGAVGRPLFLKVWANEDATTNDTMYYYGNDPVDGTAFFWEFVDGAKTLADAPALIDAETEMTAHGVSAAAWQLTRVRIENPFAGVARTCYIDDVTIAGTTYNLEGEIGSIDPGTALSSHLMKSTDGGRTWAATGYGGGPVVDMVCSSIDEDVLYVTDGYYVYKSTDAGDNFAPLAAGSLEKVLMGACGTPVTPIAITCLDVGYDASDNPFVFIGVLLTDSAPPPSVLYIEEMAYPSEWGDLELHCYGGGGYTPYSVGAAPDFADSKITYAVVSDGSDTHVISTTGTPCVWTEVAELLWDNNLANSFAIDFASRIAFPDDYEDTDTLFVGVVSTNSGGDVYSVTAPSALDLDVAGTVPSDTNIISLDIMGDTEDASLIAGAYGDTNVYYSTEGGWSWDVSAKNPTGEDTTYALWVGDSALAATSGTECAVSMSCGEEVGEYFNQISLIATDIDEVLDIDHSPGYITESETLFMLTNSTSLFRYDQTYWERVFCSTTYHGGIDMVGVSPDFNTTDTLYVGNTGFDIWRSTDAGCSWTELRYSPTDTLLSAVVIDEDTVIAGGAGYVYKTTRHGARPWDDYKVTGAGDILSFDLEPGYEDPGSILLGDSLSQVFISEDGGETWDLVEAALDTTAYDTSVVFDPGYATNNTIYAAAGNVIARCVIDPDEDWADQEWENINNRTDTANDVYMGIVAAGDTALYVTDTAIVDTDDDGGVFVDGGVLRSLNPDTDKATDVVFERLTEELVKDTTKLSGLLLTAGSNVLWSLDSVVTTNVWTYEDLLATPVLLESPADGAKIGTTGEVTLEWEALDDADEYEINLYRYCAQCPDEKETIENLTSTDTCFVYGELDAGTTYYWKVRVALGEPVLSKWSDLYEFTTALGVIPNLCSPACGASDVILTTNFSWDPVLGATGYEVEIATNEDFDPVIASGTPTVNAWAAAPELDYSTTYYWQVRAVKDGVVGAWSVCIFTTEAEPLLPPEPVEPVVIPPVQEITPAWIWAIIGIGAALVIAVIVLIVTTRRVP